MVVVAICVVFGACVSLWVRRWTYNCAYEREVTANVVIFTTAVTLRGPLFPAEAREWLRHLTGFSNVERVLGGVLALIGTATVLYIFLIRFGNAQARTRLFIKWVAVPLLIAIPTMVVLYFKTDWSRGSPGQLLGAERDGWLIAYFSVWVTAMMLMLITSLRMLHLVRRVDGRTLTKDLYLAWVIGGIGAYAIVIVCMIADTDLFQITWTLEALLALLWSFTTARAWRQRARPVKIIHPDELRKGLL